MKRTGKGNSNVSIESSRSNESGVEGLREVGSAEEEEKVRRVLVSDEGEKGVCDSRDNDDTSRSSESIELSKKLVDGLLGVSLMTRKRKREDVS